LVFEVFVFKSAKGHDGSVYHGTGAADTVSRAGPVGSAG
jgi:hypothetical protein